MNSRRFTERYRGSSHKDAFTTGTRISRDAYGMGNGNLCDKSSFVVFDPDATLILDEDVWKRELSPEIFDICGPAGCVHLGGGNYLFFGVAGVE